MKEQFLLLIFITIFIVVWISQKDGSDPTMDYSSLKGSGLSPRGYDNLVQQRQVQYTKDIKDDSTDGWIMR